MLHWMGLVLEKKQSLPSRMIFTGRLCWENKKTARLKGRSERKQCFSAHPFYGRARCWPALGAFETSRTQRGLLTPIPVLIQPHTPTAPIPAQRNGSKQWQAPIIEGLQAPRRPCQATSGNKMVRSLLVVPLGPLGFYSTQHSPTTRPLVEMTADKAFLLSGRVQLSSGEAKKCSRMQWLQLQIFGAFPGVESQKQLDLT